MVERVVALGILLGLAGCLGQTSGSGAPAASGAVAGGDGGSAALFIVVVDEAIRPLAGAKVTLDATGVTATSGADGAVRFALVEPGEHLVLVEKPGYIAARTRAAAAGEPEQVLVVLVAEPAALPFVQASKQEFYFYAAYQVGVDGVGSPGGVSVVDGGGDHDLSAGIPAWLQSEAFWEPRQPLAGQLQIRFRVCEGVVVGFCDSIHGTAGPSPVHVAASGSDLLDLGYTEEGGIASPLAPAYPPPAGAAVLVDQMVTTFTHAFYGFTPPEEWLFSRDGEPVPPA